MRTDSTTFVAATSEATRHLELDQRRADILAIGSQLAYGRVGLNASQPIYQEHGLRVAAIPTTILSVLPHYPSAHQTHLPADWITNTLTDLTRSGALDQLHAITIGYLATAAQIHAVTAWYDQHVPQRVPMILDPTFGDIGLGFYNDSRIVHPLRETLLPHATGLTPNLFELAHLTAQDHNDLSDPAVIGAAAHDLLGPGTDWVVVTGLRPLAGLSPNGQSSIGDLIVTHESTELVTHPLLEKTPAGVGDTFTASLISHLIRSKPLVESVQLAAEETARHIYHGRTR